MTKEKDSLRMESAKKTPKYYQMRAERARRCYENFVRNPQYMTEEEIRIEKRQGLLIMILLLVLTLFFFWSIVYVLLHGYPFT